MTTFLDPVCGMTVGESALRAEGFDGVAFCGPGCRAAFLADPSVYSAVLTVDDSQAEEERDDR